MKALNGVDLTITVGESLGLVGESGCGKSTLAKLILLLEKPTHGKIIFNGDDILSLSANKLKEYRKQVGIVFQDQFSSINPRQTICETIA